MPIKLHNPKIVQQMDYATKEWKQQKSQNVSVFFSTVNNNSNSETLRHAQVIKSDSIYVHLMQE